MDSVPQSFTDRAIELARTGKFPDFACLISALEAEGFADTRDRFRSPTLRVLIRSAIKAGRDRRIDDIPTVE